MRLKFIVPDVVYYGVLITLSSVLEVHKIVIASQICEMCVFRFFFLVLGGCLICLLHASSPSLAG